MKEEEQKPDESEEAREYWEEMKRIAEEKLKQLKE